jgi:hypothetical protein
MQQIDIAISDFSDADEKITLENSKREEFELMDLTDELLLNIKRLGKNFKVVSSLFKKIKSNFEKNVSL